jgi:hypothetical protein
MKKFWKNNEQWILFLLMIIHLNAFWMIFEEQMRTSEWMVLFWLFQFFGFSTLYGIRARKKGWIIHR